MESGKLILCVERGLNKMVRLDAKQFCSLVLAVLMLDPRPMWAASPAAVLGSISAYGTVAVGEVSAPAEGTLFSGDLVNTRVGSAVIQYREGTRVLLAMESTAQFTSSGVQLQKGQMTFRSAAEQGLVFNASSLRLEPLAANSTANVILNDGKASVAVTEGAVQVVDPTGARLASLQAGEARLFAMAAPPAAAPAAAAPAPAAAAPQVGGGNTVWLLALGVAATGAVLGVAGLMRANNANDDLDAAQDQIAGLQGDLNTAKGQITTLQSQQAGLQTALNAANAQITTLLAQVNSATTQTQQLSALVTQLQAAQQQAIAAQNAQNAIQAAINAALQNENDLNEEVINDLLQEQAQLLATIAGLQTTITNLTTQVQQLADLLVSP